MVIVPSRCLSCEAAPRGMTHRFGTRWIRRGSKMDGVRFISGTGHARTREDFPQHISIQQAMQFFAESVCRRLSTTKRLKGSKLGATSTSMSHSSMRRRWTSSSMTTTTMLRIPRARGQLLQKHLSRFRQWLQKSHAQNASCICAARTASIHHSHELFFRHDAGSKVRLHRVDDAMLRTGQASLQPPRSWW